MAAAEVSIGGIGDGGASKSHGGISVVLGKCPTK
jgi:hypothetical protein